VQQFGQMIDIDMTTLIEYDGQRISRIGDDWGRRRGDHTGRENRARLRGVALEVVILDRGDEPAIGIVEERHQVRPAMRLTHLAGLRIFRGRDDSVIDRPEVADEARPGDAQRHLGLAPRLIALLEF
jgi:hypothetical protein